MTIREFWHDIRERLSDERHPRREWRDERDRDWNRGFYAARSEREREQALRRERDEERRLRERAFRSRGRDTSGDWVSPRYLGSAGGFTSGAYDPGEMWAGRTWSADERSWNWRERPTDDYAEYATGYSELGWPDRYSSTLYGISFRGRGPQNWRRLDNRIREDICELMTENDELDPSDVEVQVQDGEVTLTGTVESRQDKRLAEYLAEQVSGVRDVHNRLQVHPARDTFLGTREALAGSAMGSQRHQ